MDSFALSAIPLFILLSAPIAASHARKDLYETFHKWLYKIPVGLGIANMVGCGIFAALCGSSPATAAAIGGIGIPEMRRRGYSAGLATGLIAHAGTFGILIPPSVTMILYGVATETSIGKCFIAGVIPGILLVVLSCAWLGVVFFYRKIVPARPGSTYFLETEEVDEKFSWPERFLSLFKVLPFVLIIFGVMTVNLEIGLVPPPVGLNLYVVKNIAPDVPMSQVLLGVIPFVIIDLLVIVLLCIWPELAIWLPNKMIG